MLRRRRWWVFGLIGALLVTALAPSVLAYSTGQKWQNVSSVGYQVDPNLAALLGVGDAANPVNAAANQWNQASWFTLYNPGVYDPNGVRRVSADNFQAPSRVPCGVNDGIWAITCIVFAGSSLIDTTMYFNSSPTYQWNTNGVMNGGSNPRQADVYTIALHEFGHFLVLSDFPANHAEAVMWFDATAKQALREDDKQGATQIYGPWTGWEEQNGQARGEINRLAYALNVAGWYNNFNPPPELGPHGGEFNVPVYSGTQYDRLAGYAQAGYSYAYFSLFTYENDSSGQSNYVTIRDNMTLHWCQWNYQQSTMSVDLEMTDGSTLRDSGLTDQFGVSVHPARRGGYGTGSWNCFDVNLSPLAGKTIRRYMIAYDNGNNGITGQFRAYFDDLRIIY